MHLKNRDLLARNWQSGTKLSLFLILLIVVGFVLPSIGFEKHRYLPLYADIAFSGVLVVETAIAWENRRLFITTALVCLLAIVLRWVTWFKPADTLILWRVSTGLIAILAIAGVLLSQVFRFGPVTGMRVQGAIAAYLCLGFGWAHAYHLVSLSIPGAFNGAGGDVTAVSTWVNYSFGMLTTVGYAGIVPVHPIAHTLGTGEAVTGQLYLAVLVARLVSLQVSAGTLTP